MKINDTTRTFPRSMEEAYPDTVHAEQQRQRWEWMEGHQSSQQAEFWVYITLAFAAGFVVSQLWG